MAQIPTAETIGECNDLLIHNLRINMIEVLIPRKLELPANTRLIFFSTEDREFADELLRPLHVAKYWRDARLPLLLSTRQRQNDTNHRSNAYR
jgi:hypothetical protein